MYGTRLGQLDTLWEEKDQRCQAGYLVPQRSALSYYDSFVAHCFIIFNQFALRSGYAVFHIVVGRPVCVLAIHRNASVVCCVKSNPTASKNACKFAEYA